MPGQDTSVLLTQNLDIIDVVAKIKKTEDTDLWWIVTDDLPEKIKEGLTTRNWNRTDLANFCGCSHAAVSDIIRKKVKHTRHLPKINEAFGWPQPIAPVRESP